MPKIVGVRFRTSPRMYYFAPTEGEEYKKDMKVVVETQRGVELATVILPPEEVDESKLVAPLKPVLRIATDEDIAAVAMDDAQRQKIIAEAKQKVAARNLDMKIVDCEYTVDHGKLVLYFTAEQRVDFRELVRDLASAFHNRIDLRQIGARDECKLIGSLGACGLPCCCGRFESDNEHVSIKMAKCQNLALTPNKINGMCGRLLCCLSYENKTYEDVAKRSPKVGSWVTCPDGRRGSVVSVTPLTEKVRVRVGDEDNFEFCEFLLDDIAFDKNAPRPQQQQQQNKKPQQDGSEQLDVISDDDAPAEHKPDNRKFGNKQKNKQQWRNNAEQNAEGHNGGNNNNNGGGKRNGKPNKNKKRPQNQNGQNVQPQNKNAQNQNAQQQNGQNGGNNNGFKRRNKKFNKRGSGGDGNKGSNDAPPQA